MPVNRVILAYKNFAANRAISHIGLGVAAMNTAKCLRAEGISAEVHSIASAADLAALVDTTVSHVVVSAPWIRTTDFQRIAAQHPNIHFAMNCHSNVGFLQADASGVRLIREAMEVERGTWNFHVSANSRKFCGWLQDAYHAPCIYLPNIYYLEGVSPPRQKVFDGGILRVGAFGAIRPLKNFMSAAGAGLAIAAHLGCAVELWMSTGRNEGGMGIWSAVRAMADGLPHARLVEGGWASWPKFRTTVRHMHLLLQPSYTESFNMVTADGIAEGVPSVVSAAIDWAPGHWKAPPDDVQEIARVGRHLLTDLHSAEDGYRALQAHDRDALTAWKEFLKL